MSTCSGQETELREKDALLALSANRRQQGQSAILWAFCRLFTQGCRKKKTLASSFLGEEKESN